MLKNKIHIPIPLSFRFLAYLGFGLSFLLGIALVMQGQINTDVYQKELKRIVKERTGQDIYIRGDISVVLLPVPTVYIAGVELRDISDGQPVPALTVELMQLTPTLATIFSKNPKMSSIALENVVLEIEKAEKHEINWDWLGTEINSLLSQKGHEDSINIEIIDGRIVYRTSALQKDLRIDDIYASGNSGAQASFSGSFIHNNNKISFDFSRNLNGQGAAPLSGVLYTDKQDSLKLEGNIDLSSGVMKIDAKLSADIKDIYPWIAAEDTNKKNFFAQFTNENTQNNKAPVLPIKFSGDWRQSGQSIEISEMIWQGLQSEGKGQILVGLKDVLSIDARMQFSTVDYYQWKALVENIAQQFHVKKIKEYPTDETLSENPLPKDLKISLGITSEKLVMASHVWEDVKVNLNLADAALTINQFYLALPGESTLSLFGVVSQSATTRGMRFEGSIETEGKSLKQVLSIFDESVGDLPDMGVEDFYLLSNIYISNDQIRLSESDVTIGDLELGGGLVVYYDANNPRIEADVRLADINFDYFRDLWREKQSESQPTDFFLRFDKTVNLNWLKNLQTVVDLKIQVDKFRFLERDGDSAYFRLFAQQGELGIHNVRFYYPDDITEANITLDVNGEKPFVNLLINTSIIDTDYFNPVAKKPVSSPDAEEARDKVIPGEDEEIEAVPGADTVIERVIEVEPQSNKFMVLAQADTVAAPATSVDEFAQAPAATQSGSANPGKQWSEDLIDMSWMEGVNGIFDISTGRLVHDGLDIEKVKFRARLDSSLITLQGLSFTYWGGRCEVTGSLYGGKVPGISIGFTLFNAETKDFLKTFLGINNITGKMSLSGSLSTSGVNYKSWVAQTEAKMLMSGRGIVVDGLDLQGVVDTVLVSRTAADVLNNVNRVLVGGSTEMSVDGAINVKNGILRSPGITMKSGPMSGVMNGEIKLLPWTMDLAALFQFPSLTSDTIPTLLVQLNGFIDDPVLTTDTASLEAFVVKSIKQKK